MQEVPQDAAALRDWLRELKDESQLSFEQIGQSIGEEARSVKRWLRASGNPTLPSGDVILRLLSALGVTFQPSPPRQMKAVNEQIDQLRKWLEESEIEFKQFTMEGPIRHADDDLLMTRNQWRELDRADDPALLAKLAEGVAVLVEGQNDLLRAAGLPEKQVPGQAAPTKTAAKGR